MKTPDAIRLKHMHEALTLALQMSNARTREDLSNDPMLSMALIRCLEILGEAASKISPQIRIEFPALPFGKMISMRNRLIHAYFDVDLDIVWETVSEDLPGLLPHIVQALAQIER